MALHHRPVFADKKVIICALCFIQFVVYSMRNPVLYKRHRIFWRNRSSTTRSHTCQHHAEITQSHTFAALIRLSPTTHNILTFNISEISSHNSKKLSLLPDKHLWTFLLHSSLVPGCRVVRSLGPGQSSPAILLSPNSFES